MTIPSITGDPVAALIRRVAVIGALALAAFGFSAPAASAGESEHITGSRGSVSFQHHGEILKATAGPYSGGYGVRAYLTWTDDGEHKARVTALQGAGGASSKTRNLSIREGTTVYLRMCYTNLSNEDVKCSKVQRGVA